MSQETIDTLKDLTAVIAMAASPVLAFLLLRAYTALSKALKIPVNPDFVKTIEDLAVLAAKSIEQEANKWLDKQKAQGVVEPVKMSGEEKKQLAVKAMQSLAPPAGLKLTPEQASIAIEAVVQKVKSIRPPSPSFPPPSSFPSMRPGGV